MTTIYQIAIDDLGSAFLDALRVWKNYLKGELPWNTEVAAAHRFFTDMLRVRWSPGQPPTHAQLVSLEKLAPLMDQWKIFPKLFSRRFFQAMVPDWQAGIDYVNAAFGVTVVVAHSPTPHPMNEDLIASFEWFVHHTGLHIDDSNPLHSGGIAARDNATGYEGYPIKGNLDSMKYHPPDSPWYDQTNAEVWFADEESAEKAGFTPLDN